jgi:prolyl-tRNA editing enzyme YbaK/EbsC (Cys-tRNA(Pro) deacylase)
VEQDLSASARRVQETLRALGFSHDVVELERSTRTAAEAARAIGCEVAQIAKTIVFRARPSGRAVLVVADGSSRVDESKLAAEVGERVQRADPGFVRDRTGYAIGGVPPIGAGEGFAILVDRGLLVHATIWAAAGTPRAVFRLTPAELLTMSRGRLVSVTTTRVEEAPGGA